MAYATLTLRARRTRRVAPALPGPTGSNSFTTRDVARAARARRGAARRPRAARARRHRRGPRVLERHRHVGVRRRRARRRHARDGSRRRHLATTIPPSTRSCATQDSYTWLEEAPYATIAAVRGYALGAGLQLALACDIRVFAAGTKARSARVQVRHPPRPRRHPAAPARRRRRQGEGADLHRRAGSTPRRRSASGWPSGSSTTPSSSTPSASSPTDDRRAAAARGARAPSGRSTRPAPCCRSRDGLRVEAEGQAVCLRSDDMKEAIAAFVEQRAPSYQGR